MQENTLFSPDQIAAERFVPRPYQTGAINAAVSFFNGPSKANGIVILPTGSGKSVVIANIAKELEGNTIVFQPSKEILEQNYAKFRSYGYRASIYSASAGQKRIDKVTFATIGSVAAKHHLFRDFKNILIDECFPYNQYISTERGKVKIGSLVKMFEKGVVLPRVLSYNEASKVMELKNIVSARCNGEKELIKLILSKNIVIKTTPLHPFLTSAGWKNAGDLVPGDCILSSSANGTYATIPNDDQRQLLFGSLLGDGSLDKTRKIKNINRFRFIQGLDQRSYLEWKAMLLQSEVRFIAKNGFAQTPAYAFSTKVIFIEDDKCTQEYAIENLTPRSLAVAWMDDGHLFKAGNGGSLYSTAVSKDLTFKLSEKLKSFGVDCYVKSDKSRISKRTHYYIVIGAQAIKKLSQIIAPYVHPSMAYKLFGSFKKQAGSYSWQNNFNERGAAVFLRCEKCTIEPVYNLQVEDNETYTLTSARYSGKKVVDAGLIVHNCHLVNSKGGMYHAFINALEGAKVLGLTATPYRLSNSMDGAMLKFLTRTRPRIFSTVLFIVQNDVLFNAGFLAKLQYFSFNVIDRKMLQVNSTGTDFNDASLRKYYKQIDFPKQTGYWANRLLAKRKNLLVFSSLIEEANAAARYIPGSVVITGETEKRERERILSDFKSGRIKCLLNVGVLTTGFDYPALEAVLIARSTMSLSLYYQMIGRCMRIHPEKENAWVVDLGGNYNFFGKIETMKVVQDHKGLYSVTNNGKHLTNVTFTKQ